MTMTRLVTIALPVAGLAAACNTHEPGTPSSNDPLVAFQRFTESTWRVTLDSGTSQRATWTWGPGRRSLRNDTTGQGAAGEPWRALDLYYWDAEGEEIRLLGLRPAIPTLGRGVATGTMRVDATGGRGRFDLYQPGHPRPPRKMGLEWHFGAPDRYRETLLEVSPGEQMSPLATRDFVRADPGTPPAKATNASPTGPMSPFASWFRGDWVAPRDLGVGLPADLRFRCRWLPLIEVLTVQVAAADCEVLLLEAYLYHHPTDDTVHCTAFTADGFHDGVAKIQSNGDIEADLSGDQRGSPTRAGLAVAITAQERPRVRCWSSRQGHRELILDAWLRPMP